MNWNDVCTDKNENTKTTVFYRGLKKIAGVLVSIKRKSSGKKMIPEDRKQLTNRKKDNGKGNNDKQQLWRRTRR